MANENNYTILLGYCINEKFDDINEIEESSEAMWDGIPEYSLNYSNNTIGYKIVKDNVGREELYFGIELYHFDEFEDVCSRYWNIDFLKRNFEKQINDKYFKLFNEKPVSQLCICCIHECL